MIWTSLVFISKMFPVQLSHIGCISVYNWYSVSCTLFCFASTSHFQSVCVPKKISINHDDNHISYTATSWFCILQPGAGSWCKDTLQTLRGKLFKHERKLMGCHLKDVRDHFACDTFSIGKVNIFSFLSQLYQG